jgi:hypothetical protein
MTSGLVGASLLVLAGAVACGDGKAAPGSMIAEQPTMFGGQAAGGSPSMAMAGSHVSSGGALDLIPTAGTPNDSTSGQAGVGGGCAATFVQAKLKTLAMFVMLDQSGSMREIVDQAKMVTRWQAVTTAFGSFVQNPATADFPVGLQYFGLPMTGSGSGGSGGGAATGGAAAGGAAAGGAAAGTGGGAIGFPGGPGGPGGVNGNVSCTVSDYAVPEVPIEPLAMNSQAIIASMAAHSPATTTPTLPAVQGGIQFASKYQTDHPDYKVVLVLATDGEPSGCNSTLANVVDAATMGLNGMPSIQTYVIGVGNNLSNLDAIAMAGGTQHAFLVSDGNVQQDLLMALTAIRGSEVPCEYSVPVPSTGKDLDFGKVNVQYTPTNGTAQVMQKVENAAACPASGNFWYYDNNAAPTQIKLCENSCKQLTGGGTGKVDIVLDCKETIVKPT